MTARLETLESRLAGVYNLNGKLMAVEAMAAEMGVEIHDVEVCVCAVCAPHIGSSMLPSCMLQQQAFFE